MSDLIEALAETLLAQQIEAVYVYPDGNFDLEMDDGDILTIGIDLSGDRPQIFAGRIDPGTYEEVRKELPAAKVYERGK